MQFLMEAYEKGGNVDCDCTYDAVLLHDGNVEVALLLVFVVDVSEIHRLVPFWVQASDEFVCHLNIRVVLRILHHFFWKLTGLG